MSYRALLVHVEAGDASSEARVCLAASFARRFDAAVIGVAAQAVRPPPVNAFGAAALMGAAMVAEEEQINADLQAAERAFRSHAALEGLRTEWRSGVDMPAMVLVRESRSADIVIIGQARDGISADPYLAPNPGKVIMAAGWPVLIVPPGTDSLSALRVVLAWKDVREARRAAADALPILRAADSVHVIQIAPPENAETATNRVKDVVRYLARHDVRAQGDMHTRSRASVAEELVEFARHNSADLIVAGAYGHARLTEWVFGGVTRDLLRHCPMCCLLSH